MKRLLFLLVLIPSLANAQVVITPSLGTSGGGAGTGDVVGPGSATDSALTCFDGTTGKLIKQCAAGNIVNANISASAAIAISKLATQANLTLLSNISGGSAVPSANTFTASLDAAFGSTQGQVLYRNGTVWTVLNPGTSGQFLKTQGTAANPIWATVSGSGDVVGPSSATDGDATCFDGTTGKLIKDCGLLLSLSAIAQGDLIYGTGVNTVDVLAKSATATRYLSNTGTSNNPAWAAVNLANGVTGNLAVTNLNSGTSAGSTTFWNGAGAWVVAVTPSSSDTLTNKTIVGANNTISGITEAMQTLADNTTANASTSAHGYLKKLDNDNSHCISGQGNWVACSGGGGGTIYFQEPYELRLSPSTNTYQTTSDVTAAGTIYYTPRISGGHGTITCYNGSALEVQSITQKSLALTATSGSNYNVYYDCDGTSLALGAAWTNDTTPSETIVDEQGAPVLTSDHTKLLVGVIRASGTNTTESSNAKRYIWNRFNRLQTTMRVLESTDSWTYTSATIRQANNSAANQVDFVTGLADIAVSITVQVSMAGSAVAAQAGGVIGIGLDGTTAITTSSAYFADTSTAAGIATTLYPSVTQIPAVGRHYYTWLEACSNTNEMTFFGDAGGILGGTINGGIFGIIWN